MSINKDLEKLEALTEELETQELDLDKAIKQYAKASSLAKKTLASLKKAELEIKTITDDFGAEEQ